MITKKVFLRHVLVWLIFISYELACLKFTVGIHSPILNFVMFYALNISLFYFNAYVILDFAFFKKHSPYLISTLLIIVELIGYLFIKSLFDSLLSNSSSNAATSKELTVAPTQEAISQRLR